MVANEHYRGGGTQHGGIIVNPGKLTESNSHASFEEISRLNEEIGLENSHRTIENNASMMARLGPMLDKLKKAKTPIRVGEQYLTVEEVDTKKNQVLMSNKKYYSVYAECFEDLL